MKNYNAIFAVIATAMLLAACANKEMKEENKGDASSLIEKAKQTFDNVNAVGFAWSNVEDMIKQAEEAVVSANNAEAVKLANEAIMQNELAMEQYEKEKNSGPR